MQSSGGGNSIKVSAEGIVELAVVRESAGSEILDIAAVEYALNLVFVPHLQVLKLSLQEY